MKQPCPSILSNLLCRGTFLVCWSLIPRKTDWSESKKETKLVALRDKKREKHRANCIRGPKAGSKLKKKFN